MTNSLNDFVDSHHWGPQVKPQGGKRGECCSSWVVQVLWDQTCHYISIIINDNQLLWNRTRMALLQCNSVTWTWTTKLKSRGSKKDDRICHSCTWKKCKMGKFWKRQILTQRVGEIRIKWWHQTLEPGNVNRENWEENQRERWREVFVRWDLLL